MPFYCKILIFIGLTGLVGFRCPLEKIKWMKESKTYNSKEIVDLIERINVASKKDVNTIMIGGSLSETNFEKLLQTLKTEKMYSVSKEFFEAYKSNRDALCAIIHLIKRGKLNNKQRDEAISVYLKLSQSLSNVYSIERKLPQLLFEKVENNHVYFTVTNFLNTDFPLNITSATLIQNVVYTKYSMLDSLGFEDRTQLLDVFITDNGKEYTLLPYEKTLKIPKNDSRSFYFNYSFSNSLSFNDPLRTIKEDLESETDETKRKLIQSFIDMYTSNVSQNKNNPYSNSTPTHTLLLTIINPIDQKIEELSVDINLVK